MKRPPPTPPRRLPAPHGCNEPERTDWAMVSMIAMTAVVILGVLVVTVWGIWRRA